MSTTSNYNIKHTTYWLCITAMFMALNIVTSSFSIPVPGGHLYMNDIVICTAAILLDPFAALMVGGVGSTMLLPVTMPAWNSMKLPAGIC